MKIDIRAIVLDADSIDTTGNDHWAAVTAKALEIAAAEKGCVLHILGTEEEVAELKKSDFAYDLARAGKLEWYTYSSKNDMSYYDAANAVAKELFDSYGLHTQGPAGSVKRDWVGGSVRRRTDEAIRATFVGCDLTVLTSGHINKLL